MAFTPKLWETCEGADESPWATDTDGNSISRDQTGGTISALISDANDRLEITNTTNGTRSKGWQTTQGTFTDGTIRSRVRTSHVGGTDNCSACLLLRTGTGTDGIECRLGPDGTAPDGVVDIRNYAGAFISNVAWSLTAAIWYELVFRMNGTEASALAYVSTDFPTGSDYKTITWTHQNTSASYDSGAGHAGVSMQRSMTATPTAYFQHILAFAEGDQSDVGTLTLLSATDSSFDIIFTDPSEASEHRANLWYFMRLKAGSEPADENDGTLITGSGLGMSPIDDIRSDGRFLGAFAQKTIGSLNPATTYYVRPFAVMADGSIVPGTSQSIATISLGGQRRIYLVRQNVRW